MTLCARHISRPSGEWEIIGPDEVIARTADGTWYWVALRRVGDWRWHSGAVRVPPQTAPEEQLVPELEEVVRTARASWSR